MHTSVPGGGHHGHHGGGNNGHHGHHGHHGVKQGDEGDQQGAFGNSMMHPVDSVSGSSGHEQFGSDMSGLMASVPGSSGAPSFVASDMSMQGAAQHLSMEDASPGGGHAMPFADNTTVTLADTMKPH